MAVSKSTARAAAVTPDERQREAIEHVHGPLLVVAGAGTGKTTVLTRRIASLIRNGHARPSEILALTYTDNAAKEMRERVQAELQWNRRLQPARSHLPCLLQRTSEKLWAWVQGSGRQRSLDLSAQANSRTRPQLFRARCERHPIFG